MNSETLGKIYELLNTFLPILCLTGIFYVMVVLPQRKKTLQHQNFLKALKKNDRVVMNSGIFGVIERLQEQEIRLLIAPGVTISVERSQIARLQETSVLGAKKSENTESLAS